MDAIAEGECYGLANGEGGIYLDRTPLRNRDGSWNFSGVTWDARVGTPDQDWIRGFPAVETPRPVGVTVRAGPVFAVTRRINNLEATAVRVTVGLPSLFRQDTTSGDTGGSAVNFTIRVKRATPTAGWTDYPQAVQGKTMGPYQESYRIPLDGEGPWDVQVERHTPDSNLATEQNTLNFDSFTELVDLQLTYPRTALMGIAVDGELFGNNIPSRQYDWKGWIVRVPTNYDAENRTYLSNFWNGDFKRQWTDDPAWIFYHLLTHPAGAGLQDSQIDKWALYEISRYATERVPDGFGGLEPRFSANFVLSTRTEAYSVVNALASAMRAMTYWSAGAVSIVADMPRDPEVLVTQADVVDGFEYTGSALKTRHTVALVSYLDRDNMYETAIETVEDADGIERYGWNPIEINAFACTSRSQAHRLGKWTLDTEATQTEGLSYKCSLDHMTVNPGVVAAVSDPDYANLRAGGRIASATRAQVTLDAPVTLEAGHAYRLMVTLPNGTVETRNVTTAPGTARSLSLTPALPEAPATEAQWILTSTFLAPRQFKVLGISEDSSLEFSVSAILHDPTKYARVEQGIQFEVPPVTRLPNPGVVAPPSDVTVSREYIGTPTGFVDALMVTWTASPDPFVRGYVVRYQKNLGSWQVVQEVSASSTTIYGEGPGSYTIHVQAVNFAGVMSLPAVLQVDVLNESPITLLRPTGLELEGQGVDTVFGGRDPVFAWRATALRGAYPLGQEPAAGAGYLDAIFRDFEVRVVDAQGRTVFTDHTTELRYVFRFEKNAQTPGGPHRAFTFVVLMRDKWGNLSRPAELAVANPAPPQPTNLSVQPGVGSIFVSYDRPADLDYAGTLVWVGEATGYPPGPGNLAYEGDSTYAFVRAPPSAERYVRVAAYDSFGKTGLNVSAEIRVNVGGVKDPDFLPPAVPTGLRLSTTAGQAPDGTWTYRLLAEWDANAEVDFLLYEVAIRQDAGNFVFFTANRPNHEWVVDAGSTYTVKLAGIDNSSNASVYSPEVSIAVTGRGDPPSDPTALNLISSMRTVWLQWPAHPDRDWSHMQVWEGTENNRETATHLHNATGTAFPRTGLDGGQVRFYWVRAVNRSGIPSAAFFPVSATAGVRAEVGKLTENDFPLLVVKDAFIDEIDARKIRAGSVISGQVRVEGTGTDLIGLSQTAGGDPAGAINRGSTLLEPGKIQVSGGTTLADWRHGGDTTRISGGAIAANTIAANKLAVGVRNLEVVGCAFEVSDEAASTVRWTAGTVVMTNDAGTGQATEAVSAGQAQYAGQALYLTWKRGSGGIAARTDTAAYADPESVVLAIYHGGAALVANYGRTVISGSNISTNSIAADRLRANTITARELSTGTLITNQFQLGTGTVVGAHIANAAIQDGHIVGMTFDKLTGGEILADRVQVGQAIPGYGRLYVEGGRLGMRRLVYYDSNNVERIVIGQATAAPNLAWDGIIVRNQAGVDIFTANGLGINLVGEVNINGEAVTTGKIRAGAVTGSAAVDGPLLGFTSTAGGMISAVCYLAVAAGGNTISSTWRLAAYRTADNVLIAERSVGVTTAPGIPQNVSFPLVFPLGPNVGIQFRVQSQSAGNWVTSSPGASTIVAQEFKR